MFYYRHSVKGVAGVAFMGYVYHAHPSVAYLNYKPLRCLYLEKIPLLIC